MKLFLISLSFIYIFLLQYSIGHESGSSEINRIEVTPFYDTIIISDIADIINEFDNDQVSPFDAFINSESESNENIEDLLLEYQNYLDKAHKQRRTYLEKTKTKNKVPLLRYDKYSKGKTNGNVKHENYLYNSYFSPSSVKYPLSPISSPLDLLIPISSKPKYTKLPSKLTSNSRDFVDGTGDLSVLDMLKDKRQLDLPSSVFNPQLEPTKSSCYCKNGPMPCYCKETGNRNDPKLLMFDKKISELQQNQLHTERVMSNIDYGSEGILNDVSENTINIRIKVDLQLPKIQDNIRRYIKSQNREKVIEPDERISKEFMSTINLPLPYFNFPIPMDLLVYKKGAKDNKHDNIHQITIHKKKKSRLNNNKKHRRKLITFHNIKMTSTRPPTTTEYNMSISNNQNVINTNETTNVSENLNDQLKSTINQSVVVVNNTGEPINKNGTQLEEDIYFMVNISNKSDTEKEDLQKLENNSIETEFFKTNSYNITTEKTILRRKRDMTQNLTVINLDNIIKLQNNDTQVKSNATLEKITKDKNYTKKIEKGLVADAELLYWPNTPSNQSVGSLRNITTIILERENKKEKLNISSETIRHNRTFALEQAIFGKVDWDDVDAVAPTFISFVGKYITGVLTFCSQTVCHSIKCADKKCVHRVCVPMERLNQRGHCAGSNQTDSIASMESIMDLPSNIAFEIVNILQDKMLGKLFGKVTLCISTKCVSFVAAKKIFSKSKCMIKELNVTGHCPNMKNTKNV